MQLIPENATRKVDSLGRVTLPKGLRDRFMLGENAEIELFTAQIDGRQCICLASPVDESAEERNAIEFLTNRGWRVINEAQGNIEL